MLEIKLGYILIDSNDEIFTRPEDILPDMNLCEFVEEVIRQDHQDWPQPIRIAQERRG